MTPKTTKTKRPQLIDQRLVRALGHPTRVEVLDVLTSKTLSPSQIANRLRLPLSNVIHHVKVLKENESVELVRKARRRGAIEHFYRATPKAFIGSPGWRNVPAMFRQVAAGSSLQGFVVKGIEAINKGNLNQEEARFSWLNIVVDEEGKREVAALHDSTIELLMAIHERSLKRFAGQGPEPTPYIVSVAGFEPAGA
jgi:DNA-binding transcriptional ArsR family regulator